MAQLQPVPNPKLPAPSQGSGQTPNFADMMKSPGDLTAQAARAVPPAAAVAPTEAAAITAWDPASSRRRWKSRSPQRHPGRGLRPLPVARAGCGARKLVQPHSGRGPRSAHEARQAGHRIRHPAGRKDRRDEAFRPIRRRGPRPRSMGRHHRFQPVCACPASSMGPTSRCASVSTTTRPRATSTRIRARKIGV